MLQTGLLLNKKVLILLVATIISFLPVFKADFVHYDDPEHVINNTYVQKANAANIKAIFRGDACVLFIPVTICSYYLDVCLGGTPKVFHTINLLFHLLNILLLFKLLQLLKLSQAVTFFILIFFTVNPVTTESVCWVSERKDVLYCFFLLLTAIFFLKQRQTVKYYYLSLLFFILSCLSKPMAVSFPLIVGIYLYTQNTLRSNLVKLLPFVLAAIITALLAYYFIMVKNGPVAKTNFTNYNLPQKSFLFISQIGYYFTSYLWPVNISLFHFLPEPSKLYTIKTTLYFSGGLLYLFCLFYFRKNKYILGLLIAWLITLLPVLQIVPNSQSYVNDRYFYLTLTLPVYFAGYYLQKLISVNSFMLFCYGILLIFTVLTFKQAGSWKNSETLFKYELSINNKNCTALNILGSYYNNRLEYDKAKSHLALAVAIESTNATYLNNYSRSLSGIERSDSAILFLKRAIRYKENYIEAYNNLGACYLKTGEKEKAFENFKTAEQINPDNPDVIFNIGLFLFFEGQKQKGACYLKKAATKGNLRAKMLVEKFDL